VVVDASAIRGIHHVSRGRLEVCGVVGVVVCCRVNAATRLDVRSELEVEALTAHGVTL
jgi:PIN domain nuclease of toxin-antitoxin system